MWPTLLYRVKVYSKWACIPGASFANRLHLWSFWEAQLQVWCISEVPSSYTSLKVITSLLCIDGHSWGSCAPPATSWSITHNDILPFRVLCASGLHFDCWHLYLHYCLYYLLQGDWVAVDTWHEQSFMVECGNTWNSANPSLYSRLVRCSAHGCCFAKLQYYIH